MATRSKVQAVGPLAAHSEGLHETLAASGYSSWSLRSHARVLAELSQWLLDEELEPQQFGTEEVNAFLDHRRATGATSAISARGIRPVLDYLRVVGVVPPATTPANDVNGQLLAAYRRYMSVQRCLADLTIQRNEETASRFLFQRGGVIDPFDLEAGEVTGYLLGAAEHMSVASLSVVGSSLRDFVRFLYATGVVPRDLSGAIPGVTNPRLASLPRAIDPSVVACILESCAQDRPGGMRDFAILTLLARLGLRAFEVASMRLDDIDWRAGEFLVRGKGGRRDMMPIPADVGDALAGYLTKGRPTSESRAVFLALLAPRAPMSRNAVVFVSRSASKRVGIPVVGAHRLRHTVATEMLANGASLREISGALRHESEQTTAIYAKVDRASLDLAVRPWPVTS